MGAHMSRLMQKHLSVDTRATTHLTIGSILSFDGPGGFEGSSSLPEVPMPPRLTVRSSKASELSAQDQIALRSRVYIDCALPQLRASLHKPPLDGLQLWADDFSQWAQTLASLSPLPSHHDESEGEDLIGSRFFARGAAKSISSSTTTSSQTRSSTLQLQKGSSCDVEAIVSLAITEGVIYIVPTSSCSYSNISSLGSTVGATRRQCSVRIYRSSPLQHCCV
jgi:hypothetical protein